MSTAAQPRAARIPTSDPYGRPEAGSPAQRTALRVVQAGAILVVLAAAVYKVFELDRFFVPKELVLHLTALIAGVLAVGAAKRAEITRVDLALGGFLLLSTASALLAQNPWMGVRSLAIGASGVVLFWTARALARAGLGRPLLATLAIAVALAAATSLLQTYGVRTDFFSINRAPGGTLGNRNFVAHLCAFGLPLLFLAGLRAYRFAGLFLAGAGVAMLAATLVLTRSRAAWLGAAAVLAVFLLGWLLVPPVRRQAKSWMRLMVLLAFAAGGGAASLAVPNKLRWNSDNPYAETARGVVNYREGSGAGRLVQYRNSLRMAIASPILGVGPGNWSVAYPRYARAGDPSMDRRTGGMTSNPWPSSDWVAFLSERGLPAFLLLVFAGYGLLVIAWRRMRGARDADEGLLSLALAATIAGTFVVGTFDAVLMLALPSLLVWTALGALSANEPGRWEVDVGAPKRILGAVVVIAVFGVFAAKSAGQLAAMAVFANSGSRASLERAATLDPGNYRLRLRLARSGPRAQRCPHAIAAHELYPEADAAAAAARRCD